MTDNHLSKSGHVKKREGNQQMRIKWAECGLRTVSTRMVRAPPTNGRETRPPARGILDSLALTYHKPVSRV